MTIDDIERYRAKIDEFISGLDNKFTDRLNTLSKRLYANVRKSIIDKLEVDNKGNITISAHNMRVIGELGNVFKALDFTQLISKSVSDYLTIIEATSPYFELFGIAADKIKAIESDMLPRMKARAKVFGSMTLRRKDAVNARKALIRAVAKGKSYTDLTKDIRRWFVKDNRAMANIKTELRDVFMEGDRWVTHEMTKEFNLDRYYLYTGGLVNRSRDFCETKNRRAFTHSEVMSWKNQSWQGKSIPYNPFINVGGYNCRHRLMPISEQMYKRIKGLWVNTANKKMRTFRNFTDYQTVTYNIAGQEVDVSVASNLKIYAGNTIYLNKKKVAISEDDVNTIETAQAEFFITKVLNNVENNRIFYKGGAFQFKERAFGYRYEIKKEKEVRELLASLNIEIINL